MVEQSPRDSQRHKDKHQQKTDEQSFRDSVARQERRKLHARRRGDRGPWFWLGMFGLVGWSVAVPAVIGTMLGAWLDQRFDGRVSWTLTLLLIGVAVGCWTAWYWIGRESRRE